MNTKPRLFIGSASESKPIVDALISKLGKTVNAEPWYNSFPQGEHTLQSLANKATDTEFAAFIVGKEDTTESREVATSSPRDNVIYEAGLFAGHLGVSRVFLLIATGTKIPTDWLGLTTIFYDHKGENTIKDIQKAAQIIRDALNSWVNKTKISLEYLILGHWWQYVINEDAGSVLSLLSITRALNSKLYRIDGEAWTNKGKKIAKYWSRATDLDIKNRKFFYYWEGDHSHDPNIPKYLGVGEIVFDDDQTYTINRANGWYSETPLTGQKIQLENLLSISGQANKTFKY
ncbi:MAG: nucleotide-binding protein [Saprospiraceae bacterium]|nr:nucleotide-binding protein [Saprospiraceae bacterium]